MSLSLSDLLFDRAAREPLAPAIITPDEEISVGELATESAALAQLLTSEGFGEKRITLLLPNIPRFAVVLHGVLAAGGGVVMCNPLNSPREVQEQLEDAGSAAVMTTEALHPLAPPGTPALLVDGLPNHLRIIPESGPERIIPLPLADHRSRPQPISRRGGTEEAAVLFTAAEEGRARGAILTHRGLIANLRSTATMMRLREGDRVLGLLPQVHAFGLTVGLNAPLAAGAAIVPVERYHPVRTLELTIKMGVTVFAGVPAMFIGLLLVLERAPQPLDTLRITLSGGAPLPVEVQRRWEAVTGIPLRQGYGLTEASPVCLFNAPDQPNRPGTLGRPVPGVKVTIQDSGGRILPDGEVGEICVQGENVFPGFLDGIHTPDHPLRNGWLRTGDLGTSDKDGYIRFIGLTKPMFTRSGFNIYPREVERVLEDDERIAKARVSPLPDPVKENEILLEVEPAAGSTITEDDVRELCRSRLAAYKQPARITIVTG